MFLVSNVYPITYEANISSSETSTFLFCHCARVFPIGVSRSLRGRSSACHSSNVIFGSLTCVIFHIFVQLLARVLPTTTSNIGLVSFLFVLHRSSFRSGPFVAFRTQIRRTLTRDKRKKNIKENFVQDCDSINNDQLVRFICSLRTRSLGKLYYFYFYNSRKKKKKTIADFEDNVDAEQSDFSRLMAKVTLSFFVNCCIIRNLWNKEQKKSSELAVNAPEL